MKKMIQSLILVLITFAGFTVHADVLRCRVMADDFLTNAPSIKYDVENNVGTEGTVKTSLGNVWGYSIDITTEITNAPLGTGLFLQVKKGTQTQRSTGKDSVNHTLELSSGKKVIDVSCNVEVVR